MVQNCVCFFYQSKLFWPFLYIKYDFNRIPPRPFAAFQNFAESYRAVVLKLFSESIILIQKKIQSIKKLNFEKKSRKFAKISTHKFPNLVSKV